MATNASFKTPHVAYSIGKLFIICVYSISLVAPCQAGKLNLTILRDLKPAKHKGTKESYPRTFKTPASLS